MGLPDITLQQLLQRVAAYALVTGVYGLATTALVRWFGDEGPTHDGRRTLNPLVHLDIVGMLAAVFFRVAWMKPLDVDVTALRRPRLAAALVIVLSSIALLAFGALCLIARPAMQGILGGDAAIVLTNVLTATFEVSVAAALLNLLPIPPLTGSLWVGVVWPRASGLFRRSQMRLAGTVVLVLALLLGWVTPSVRAAWTAVRAGLGY